MASVLKGQSGQPISFETKPNVNGDDIVLDSYVGGQTLSNGTATFTNSTNNISATGIGVGVEVGDVIQISGSVNNDTEFTVEVITDANNVIVNQAHAGGTTSKSLVNETAAVTVKLLCKWYLASVGLGQVWKDATPSRTNGVTYINATGRPIQLSITTTLDTGASPSNGLFSIDGQGVATGSISGSGRYRPIWCPVIPAGSTYRVDGFINIHQWWELR